MLVVPPAEHGTFPTAGPGIAVMLRQPEAPGIRQRVKAMLDKLAANPDYGIARILDGAGIARMGGFPDAAYYVELKLGYALGGGASGPAITQVPSTGQHGYLPDHAEMRASLFLLGKGVPAGEDLGIVDMRQIAPTLAGLLGVPFSSAPLPPLDLRKP